MAIEIGSLVVRGTFGNPHVVEAVTPERVAEQIGEMRRALLEEVRDILDDAERRARER